LRESSEPERCGDTSHSPALLSHPRCTTARLARARYGKKVPSVSPTSLMSFGSRAASRTSSGTSATCVSRFSPLTQMPPARGSWWRDFSENWIGHRRTGPSPDRYDCALDTLRCRISPLQTSMCPSSYIERKARWITLPFRGTPLPSSASTISRSINLLRASSTP
jgi:hypothetical protein